MSSNKYSNLKIIHFPEKLQSFRESKLTAPIYVRIKPINACSHFCSWCVYHASDKSLMHEGMNDRDTIPTNKLFEILHDLRSMGVKAITYSGGGEPLMHKSIAEIMQLTLDLGLDLSIITHGQFLKDKKAEVLSHAKWVRVSMDYNNAEDMHKSRGVKLSAFDEVLNNVLAFSKIKQPTCDLTVNYIVHKDNCQGLADFAKTLKNCGVENVRFSPMWVAPGFHEYHAKIKDTVEDQLGQARGLIDDTFSINTTYDLSSSSHGIERAYCKCHFMQVVPVIGADLNVYSCHNKAYDPKGLIGSIKERKFSELWFSEEARARFEGLNPKTDCRHQCAADEKNKIMADIVNTAVDNFV